MAARLMMKNATRRGASAEGNSDDNVTIKPTGDEASAGDDATTTSDASGAGSGTEAKIGRAHV